MGLCILCSFVHRCLGYSWLFCILEGFVWKLAFSKWGIWMFQSKIPHDPLCSYAHQFLNISQLAWYAKGRVFVQGPELRVTVTAGFTSDYYYKSTWLCFLNYGTLHHLATFYQWNMVKPVGKFRFSKCGTRENSTSPLSIGTQSQYQVWRVYKPGRSVTCQHLTWRLTTVVGGWTNCPTKNMLVKFGSSSPNFRGEN